MVWAYDICRHPPARHGAWTGALIAALLDMRVKYALPSIALGVLIAGFLITGLTFGFTSVFA